MKLNLEFIDDEYKDNISIADSTIIEKYFSDSKIEYSDDDLQYYLLFSKNRLNIIKWYEFTKSPKILDLSPNFGELDEYLSSIGSKLDIISESKKRAEVIGKRCSKCDNVEIFVGALDKVELKEKYDYIIIIGEVDKDSLKAKLKYAKALLNKNGKILLSFDNKLGMKYWTGLKEQQPDRYYSIVGSTRGVALHDIKKYLDRYELKYKLYFPLPDYRITNVIFSEDRLPDFDSLISRYSEYYFSDDHANFIQSLAMAQLVNDNPNNFCSMANSFFLEIGKNTIKNDTVYVNFELIRRDKYHIMTIMKDKYVYKSCNFPESKNHVEQIKRNIDIINKNKINTLDSYNDEGIVSKISKEQTLDKVMTALYKNDEVDEMYELFDRFIEDVVKKQEEIVQPENTVFKKYDIDIEDNNDFHYVKDGLIDLLTQNTFFIDKKFFVYDQEWMEQNVPIEFIIYRNIIYNITFCINGLCDELYRKYGIDKYIEVFKQLEDKIQASIRENIFIRFHARSVQTAQPLNDEYARQKVQISELEHNLSEMNEKYKVVSERADTFENNLRIIEASLSWKITKPLRYISWKLRLLKRKFNGRK